MTLATLPRYRRDAVARADGHAVVVGASVAGLLAARVLSDGYRTVTVLERGSLPGDPVPRRGTPQADHVHVLLEAGRATMSDLFPGFDEALLSAGGLSIDESRDLAYYQEGDFVADALDRRSLYTASRPLLEQVLRRQVRALDDVTFRPGCQVVDLVLDDDADRVDGVAFRPDDGPRADADRGADDADRGAGDGHAVLDCDLVVDATGRTSPIPARLADRGFDKPPVDEVTVDLAYTTVVLDRPPADRRAFLVAPTPPSTRGGTVVPVEDDRWIVTLFGLHGEHPPRDRRGLEAFAGGLPVPQLRRLLETRSIASEDVRHYPFASSRRRRYRDVDRLPAGLIALGDSLASFNPIYGQGMSAAALEALALHRVLATGDREGLAERYFDLAGSVVDLVWTVAVGADFRHAQTEGPKPRGSDLFNRYLGRVIRRAHSDRRVATAFRRVLRLERPPTHLLRPDVATRVVLPRRAIAPLDRLRSP